MIVATRKLFKKLEKHQAPDLFGNIYYRNFMAMQSETLRFLQMTDPTKTENSVPAGI